VINLLVDMQASLGLTMLFIGHNLAVIRHICQRVAVISDGQIVELGPRQQIFDAPRHPYTRALLDAVPIPDPHASERKQQEEVLHAHRS
jgi:ABC-type oligopeptide transport system ATPase subunit